LPARHDAGATCVGSARGARGSRVHGVPSPDWGEQKGDFRNGRGSERVVYLADSLIDLLAQHVAAFGSNGPQQWLFAGEGDDPPHQNTIGYWWRKTLRNAGQSGTKLHDLRHFYASGLIAAGCDVVTVQRSRAFEGDHDPEHLRPPLADRRGPHPQGGRVDHCRVVRCERSGADRCRMRWLRVLCAARDSSLDQGGVTAGVYQREDVDPVVPDEVDRHVMEAGQQYPAIGLEEIARDSGNRARRSICSSIRARSGLAGAGCWSGAVCRSRL
jgi:hypothetical protein